MPYRFGTQFGHAGIVRAILLGASLAWALPAPAHAADIQYIYDENGRLVEVVAADGASAQYRYDAVGNLSSIKKNAAATLSIAEFTPNSGPAGTPVTLYGSGFSTVAGNNAVKFNGVAAFVSAATATSLNATVPAGATTGRISVSNPGGSVTFSTARAGQRGRYTFNGNAGQKHWMVLTNGTFINGASITVLNPNGGALTFASLGSVKSFDIPALPAAGTYTVLVAPNGAATGRLDLQLKSTLADRTGSIAIDGPPVRVDLTPHQKGLISFSGVAGQILGLGYSGVSTMPAGQSIAYSVLKPNGGILLSKLSATGNSSNLTPLPDTGTYTIELKSSGDGTASATLTLSSELAGTLAAGAPPTTFSTARAGQNGHYTFTGGAGQQHSMALTNGTFPDGVGITVQKPDGAVLAAITVSSANTLAIPALPVAGIYTVFVDPYRAGTGKLNIQLK